MEDHIGARIGYWRKRRGLTQAVLAGLAGVSQPFVSQVEAGQKGIERRSTLVAIAGALQVSVADLLGQPGDPTDPAKAGVARVVPAIRLALIEIEEGERAPSRDVEQVATAIEHMTELRSRSDYAGMARADISRAIDAGLRFRALAETVRDTYEWDASEPGERPTLSPEKEAAVLSAARAA